MSLRRVAVLNYDPPGGIRLHGWFHGWSDTNSDTPQAIVECDDGSVVKAPFYLVKFVEPGVDLRIR